MFWVAEARWIEVMLTVNGELAEAVAEVLDRYSSNGVVYESGVAFLHDEDEGTAAGPIKVYAYLPVDEYLEEKRQRLGRSPLASGTDSAITRAFLPPDRR